jgi:hypothetical protein
MTDFGEGHRFACGFRVRGYGAERRHHGRGYGRSFWAVRDGAAAARSLSIRACNFSGS